MQQYTIRNFGPIRDIAFELAPFTVFIGTQGVGKSTIGKIVTISNDLLWYLNVVTGKDEMRTFALMGIKKYFQPDTYLKYWNGHYGFVYENGQFHIGVDEVAPEDFPQFFGNMIAQASSPLVTTANATPDTEHKDLQRANEFMLFRSNLRSLCYIPTERIIAATLMESLASIMLNRIPLPAITLEYLSLFEKAKNHLDSFSSDFLGVRYVSGRGRENIQVDEQRDRWLAISECSSGVQSTLPMLMVMNYCKGTYFDAFVLEEPEENLFPANQYALLKELVAYTNDEHPSSFVINTHSPYLLSALNICILAHKVGNNPAWSEAVAEVLPRKYWIDGNKVAVYALDQHGEANITSVINQKTGLITGNFLDSASEIINADFNRLYKIYIQSKKDGKSK